MRLLLLGGIVFAAIGVAVFRARTSPLSKKRGLPSQGAQPSQGVPPLASPPLASPPRLPLLDTLLRGAMSYEDDPSDVVRVGATSAADGKGFWLFGFHYYAFDRTYDLVYYLVRPDGTAVEYLASTRVLNQSRKPGDFLATPLGAYFPNADDQGPPAFHEVSSSDLVASAGSWEELELIAESDVVVHRKWTVSGHSASPGGYKDELLDLSQHCDVTLAPVPSYA